MNIFDSIKGFAATATEAPLYKGLQAGADLYSGITRRLKETAQEDIAQKQAEKDKETIDFVQYLGNQGKSQGEINQVLSQLQESGKLKVSPNFATRLVSGIGERMQDIGETTEILSQEQNLAKRFAAGVPYYGGTAVATAFEPLAAAAAPYVEPFIEPIVKTKPVQSAISAYGEFAKENPLAAKGIEGIANISSLAPLPFAKPIGGAAKKGFSTAVKNVSRGAEYIVPDLTKTAKNIASKAEMGFRKQAEEIALPSLSDMGARERSKVAGDVIETKPGLFSKEELVRSPQEALSIEEISRMIKEGKIKKGASEIKNAGVVESEIATLAKNLDSDMKDVVHTPMQRVEVESLFDDIARGIDENPVLGEMKNTTDRVISQLRKNLNKDVYSASDLIDLRKQFDADIRRFKGDLPFSPERETAFSTILKDFRQGLNNKAAELVPDAKVRQLLDRQSALYIARDTIESRWAKQANTTIGRILSKIQKTTGIPRTEIIELSTALGLAGVFTPIIGPIATAAAGGALVKAGAKKLLSPHNKLKLSKFLEKLDASIKEAPKDTELKKVRELFTNPTKNGGSITNIFSDSNTRGVPKSLNTNK